MVDISAVQDRSGPYPWWTSCSETNFHLLKPISDRKTALMSTFNGKILAKKDPRSFIHKLNMAFVLPTLYTRWSGNLTRLCQAICEPMWAFGPRHFLFHPQTFIEESQYLPCWPALPPTLGSGSQLNWLPKCGTWNQKSFLSKMEFPDDHK